MSRWVSLLARVGKGIDRLSEAGGWAAGLILLGMILIITYEVVMRYAFNRPTNWVLETAMLGQIMVAYLAAAWVLKEERHITIDVLVGRLTRKTRMSLEVVILFLSVIFCVILAWYGYRMVSWSLAHHETSTTVLKLPMWLPKIAVPGGAGLMALQGLRMMVSRLGLLARGEAGGEATVRGLSLQNPRVLLPLYIAIIIVAAWLVYSMPTTGIVVLLFILLFGGVPVVFALGLVGTATLYFLIGGDTALNLTAVIGFHKMHNFVLAALPLFIFCATAFAIGGISGRLYDVASAWVGHFPGGLVLATVVAATFFGAICGSTVAATAAIGLVALPEMIRRGVSKRLAYGVACAVGTISTLIPPGVGLIMYGDITDTSIGALFMGGVGPGLASALYLSLYVLYCCRGGRNYVRQPATSWKEKFVSLRRAFWGLLAPVIIIGGIYSGVFTPTESAAVASVYALLAVVLLMKTVKWQQMRQIILDSARTSGTILLIIVSATLLGHAITVLKIPDRLLELILAAELNRWVVIVIINLFMVVLGCFLEGVSILMIVTPVAFPIIVALGFDPVWFGVMFIVNLEIAMITPPVGMNLFVVKGITNESIGEIIRAAAPIILVFAAHLALVIAWPPLTLWLPGMMMKR